MSRYSRRVSRPLIAGVAGVIVIGTIFTLHKLHSAGASEANKQVAAAPNTEDKPVLTPQQLSPDEVKKPADKPVAADATKKPASIASTDTTGSANLDSGVVTQTPTGPIAAVSNATLPTTQPDTATKLNSTAQARADFSEPSRSAQSPDPSPATPPAASTASEVTVSAQPLQDAKSKMDAGDLLASRQLLNDALISGRMNETDAEAAKKQIDEINKTVIFSARKFANDPWGGIYTVASGERMATIANKYGVTYDFLSRVNGVTPKKMRSGQTLKVFKGPFYAVVYKKQFKMEIYLGAPSGPGSMYVTTFPVGLGKDNSTPTGMWLCKAGDKIRNPRYYPPHGGDILAPDDPKNPLGGYWIAIEGTDGQALGAESYGIHGTIDPTSIGKMESMGCIRLKAADISWVFDILVDGKSKVLVKD